MLDLHFCSSYVEVLKSMTRSKLITDKQTDVRKDSPCVLQDFVPFGAAALLLSDKTFNKLI